MNYYGNHVDAVDDSELHDREEDTTDSQIECAFCKDDVHEDETIQDPDTEERYCFDCMRKGRHELHLEKTFDGTVEERQEKAKQLTTIYRNLKK